jgi:tRNAThr (cytosine32-N3)-methyltransferase
MAETTHSLQPDTDAAPAAEKDLTAGLSSLSIDNPAVADMAPGPSRSHDPDNNLKRSDPFQFGSRYLQQEDNVFEFNAWDHVETDDTYKEYAELQYAKQREAPVSDFDKSMYYPIFHSTFPPKAS